MCLLYGTKGSPSYMITVSRRVVSRTVKLFYFDVSYNSIESASIFRKKEANSFSFPGNKPTRNMKTSFVVFALVMLLVAISGAQASGKPRLDDSSKSSIAYSLNSVIY